MVVHLRGEIVNILKWEKIHLIKREKTIHAQLSVFIKDWSRKSWSHDM